MKNNLGMTKMSSTHAINGQEVNWRIGMLPQPFCVIQFWGNSPGRRWRILPLWPSRTAAIGSGLVLPSSGRWTSSASKPWWRPPRKRLSRRGELKGETIRWLSGGRETNDWTQDAGLPSSEGKNLRKKLLNLINSISRLWSNWPKINIESYNLRLCAEKCKLFFLPGNLPFLQSVFHSWWYSTICLVNLPWALSKKIERDSPRPGECYPCTSVPMLGWDTMDWAKAAGPGHLTSNPLPILLNSPFQWESRPLSAQQTKPVHLCSNGGGRRFDHQTSRATETMKL